MNNNDAYHRTQDIARSAYDRTLEMFLHEPDTKVSKPATQQVVMPFVGDVRTFVVRTGRSKEYGFALFVEITGPDGNTRIVLPDKACQAIYRQRESLVDRSTPASRARKAATAQRKREKAQKAARKARRAGVA